MGGLQSTERSLSVTASKGLSALRAAPDLCCAVNQRLTSVVREIRTLRSVGAGGSAPGDPVDVETESRRGYLGTARRKGRLQTNQTYGHRATSRLYHEATFDRSARLRVADRPEPVSRRSAQLAV